ncbi:MFS transporter [Streptomyces sp. SID5643]|nr:MFS transporter [Streptomyces sp. SID5643]
MLVVLAAVNGAASSCYPPAAQALLPQTVPAESRRAALALSRIASSSAMIVGASLGGVLVAAVGPGWGLAVDAAGFALAAASFALIRVQAAAPAPSPGLVHELRVGWQEFTSRSWVWVIVAAFCVLNAGVTASFAVLGPAVADTTGIGRSGWGVVVAAGSLGAVAGGVLSLSWRPRRAILVGCALMGLAAMPPLLLARPVHLGACGGQLRDRRGRRAGRRRLVLDPERADPRGPPGARLRLRRPRLLPRSAARPVHRRTRRPLLRPARHPLRVCRAHPPRHPRHGRHPLRPRAGGEDARTAARLRGSGSLLSPIRRVRMDRHAGIGSLHVAHTPPDRMRGCPQLPALSPSMMISRGPALWSWSAPSNPGTTWSAPI